MPSSHTVPNALAFRCNDRLAMRLEQLRDTFTEPGWRPVFEWLLTQPDVENVILERVMAHRVADPAPG
jgi:hypothetical protein